MNLYEAKKMLNRKGYKLIKESYTFNAGQGYIKVIRGGKNYYAQGVIAMAGEYSGEIDPYSITFRVSHWVDDEENEVPETESLKIALRDRLAEPDLAKYWRKSNYIK